MARVPEDVIDRILTSLTDFDALRSTIVTSKEAYNVFLCRKQSIVRSVALNVVGPSLEQALCLVRAASAEWTLGEDEVAGWDTDRMAVSNFDALF